MGSISLNLLPNITSRVQQTFQQLYGAAPEALAYAPGRVNLIGEHTDYNMGWVMPFAIDRGIICAARVVPGGHAEIRTDYVPDGFTQFAITDPVVQESGWSSYLRGVVQGHLEAGVSVPGFQAYVSGNLPPGGGLSSSAALEVATALCLQKLSGTKLPAMQTALLAQKAEHYYAGTPCGIMDQFAVTFAKAGHVLLLDCRAQQWRDVPFAEGGPAVLVINSNVRHALNDGGYLARRQSCEAAAAALGLASLREAQIPDLDCLANPTLLRRARHVITENVRCQQAADALQQGDWEALGQLLYASHASLRDDFEVSCAELDTIVDICQEIGMAGGIFGARMTGGGFGGCCVALVQPERAEKIRDTVAATYGERTGITPVAFLTWPSAAAEILAC